MWQSIRCGCKGRKTVTHSKITKLLGTSEWSRTSFVVHRDALENPNKTLLPQSLYATAIQMILHSPRTPAARRPPIAKNQSGQQSGVRRGVWQFACRIISKCRTFWVGSDPTQHYSGLADRRCRAWGISKCCCCCWFGPLAPSLFTVLS